MRAQAAQAAANLQSARASADAARTRAARYKPLAEMEAISKQDYTDAVAQARQADAAVAQNNAALRAGADQHALHPRAGADQRAASACPTSPKVRWSPPTRPIR